MEFVVALRVWSLGGCHCEDILQDPASVRIHRDAEGSCSRGLGLRV